MANIGRQGVYSPLPQSISDSDSEKELQMDSLYTSYSTHEHHNGIFGKHLQRNGTTIPNHIEIKPKEGFRNMSPIRKFNFIFSIFLCFFTIFVFIWVLPCNEGTCPVKINHWDRTHENIEMKGQINVVRNAYNDKENLAVLFKHNINSTEKSNGIISLIGNTGEVAWYMLESEIPIYLNCHDLDANQDNVLDCLLTSDLGLKLIEPVSGDLLWTKKLNKITDNPIVINDLNKDNVKEILVIQTNEVNIISGGTGVVLVSFILKHCKFVKSEIFADKNYLYLCHTKLKESYYKIDQVTLSKLLRNNQTKIDMFPVSYQRKTNEYSLNERKLLINNKGNCPNCTSRITLIDEKTNEQVLDWSYSNTYVMAPKTFTFSATKENLQLLKGHINGFILKLWQWTGHSTNFINHVKSNKINVIKEKIMLLTFNNTDFHIINASSNNINQLCISINKGLLECQPNIQNQNDSLLITDLNQDNSLELVSYSSSYEFKIATNKWHLISNIKLIRLEAELPKLYESNN